MQPLQESTIMKECSVSISELIGKPESFILVSLETNKMIFGGTDGPCAYVVCVTHLPLFASLSTMNETMS